MANLIKPTINANEVAVFLWEHLVVDLEVIGQSTGKSSDDTVLTVHLILQHMLTIQGDPAVSLLYCA